MLDLHTGFLDTPKLSVIQIKEPKTKQVRKNSKDLYSASSIAEVAVEAAQRAKVIFVEVPHGSQSARAMASYGICVGILGAMRASGLTLIEVSASEVKKVFTGDPQATKELMIAKAKEYYPDAQMPVAASKAEHLADAIAAIHAGCLTNEFQTLMQIFHNINTGE